MDPSLEGDQDYSEYDDDYDVVVDYLEGGSADGHLYTYVCPSSCNHAWTMDMDF